jgi:hypothetical protein
MTIVVVIAMPPVDILYASLIAPLEGLAIFMPRLMWHIRMPVLLAIVNVGLAMVIKIPPSALDAVVIPTLRYLAPVVVRNPRPRLVVVSRGRWAFLGFRSGDAKSGDSHSDE